MNKKINDNIDLIRVFSDLHLDFDFNQKNKKFIPEKDLWHPFDLETDKKTTLILAGDIWHSKKGFSFMGYSWYKEISKKYKYVILVLGNHDYWGGNLTTEHIKIKNYIQEQSIENMFVLQNEKLEFNNTNILGTTLWLNFDNNNKFVIDTFNQISSDKKYIRVGNNFSKINFNHIYKEHCKALMFLKNNLRNNNNLQNIVISHHPPSKQSLEDNIINYLEENINNISNFSEKEKINFYSHYLDFNNLESLFYDYDIDLWIHGHTHTPKQYKINKTNIINNARGYLENNYIEDLIININKKNNNLSNCVTLRHN